MANRIISPSMLSADFSRLTEEVQMINHSKAEWLHVDVMDGVFVPNISFGFPIMEVLKKHCRKPLDVHLMITHPERYVERFADAGAWSIGFHLEAVDNPRPILNLIRKKNCRTCLTINPDISVERLLPYIAEVDMVLLMSVYAGYGGQRFIEDTYDRLCKVRNFIDENGLNTLIEIDGGVNTGNSELLWKAGADVLVAGSAVFKAKNPEQEILRLKGIM